MQLSQVLTQFSINLPAKPIVRGNVNSTFAVGEPPVYILQKINTTAFLNPQELMENVVAVAAHLRKKVEAAGGDPNRETLTFLPTVEGRPIYYDPEGNVWRVYRFVGDAVTYNTATPELFAESARAFGRFQQMLADFPAETLHETIPRFHDTVYRLERLKQAIAEDRAGRADRVQAEISFALARAKDTTLIVDGIRNGSIPLHVTHNDTKLNNVLFDCSTKRAICVIDLDTVMPGSLLYDYGDAVRFGASTAAEDEPDLSRVGFDLTMFRAYTDAYLEVLKGKITPREVELFPASIRLLTLELGMRFLTDYLNGDVYFRTDRPGHNLDRARAQFKLVEVLESQAEQLQKILFELCLQYGVSIIQN